MGGFGIRRNLFFKDRSTSPIPPWSIRTGSGHRLALSSLPSSQETGGDMRKWNMTADVRRLGALLSAAAIVATLGTVVSPVGTRGRHTRHRAGRVDAVRDALRHTDDGDADGHQCHRHRRVQPELQRQAPARCDAGVSDARPDPHAHRRHRPPGAHLGERRRPAGRHHRIDHLLVPGDQPHVQHRQHDHRRGRRIREQRPAVRARLRHRHRQRHHRCERIGHRRRVDHVDAVPDHQVRTEPRGRTAAWCARPQDRLHADRREQPRPGHVGLRAAGLPARRPRVPRLHRGRQHHGRRRGVHRQRTHRCHARIPRSATRA